MCFILPGGGTYLNNTLIIILVVEVYHSFKEEVSCQHGSQKIYTKSPFNDFISQNHNYENYKIICYNITPFQAKSKSKMHQENLLQYSSVPKRIIYTYNSEIFMSGTHDEIVDVFSLLKKNTETINFPILPINHPGCNILPILKFTYADFIPLMINHCK